MFVRYDVISLIIPVINEMFGEKYSGNEEIVFSVNEHFLNQQSGNEDERITDTSFQIEPGRGIPAFFIKLIMELYSDNNGGRLLPGNQVDGGAVVKAVFCTVG